MAGHWPVQHDRIGRNRRAQPGMAKGLLFEAFDFSEYAGRRIA
jgi:hypothetical protein